MQCENLSCYTTPYYHDPSLCFSFFVFFLFFPLFLACSHTPTIIFTWPLPFSLSLHTSPGHTPAARFPPSHTLTHPHSCCQSVISDYYIYPSVITTICQIVVRDSPAISLYSYQPMFVFPCPVLFLVFFMSQSQFSVI